MFGVFYHVLCLDPGGDRMCDKINANPGGTIVNLHPPTVTPRR